MKKIGIKNIIFYVLFFFVASCVGTKNNKPKTILAAIPPKIEHVVPVDSSKVSKTF